MAEYRRGSPVHRPRIRPGGPACRSRTRRLLTPTSRTSSSSCESLLCYLMLVSVQMGPDCCTSDYFTRLIILLIYLQLSTLLSRRRFIPFLKLLTPWCPSVSCHSSMLFVDRDRLLHIIESRNSLVVLNSKFCIVRKAVFFFEGANSRSTLVYLNFLAGTLFSNKMSSSPNVRSLSSVRAPFS